MFQRIPETHGAVVGVAHEADKAGHRAAAGIARRQRRDSGIDVKVDFWIRDPVAQRRTSIGPVTGGKKGDLVAILHRRILPISDSRRS